MVQAGLGMIGHLKGRAESKLDFIPVDLTANVIIATARQTALNK